MVKFKNEKLITAIGMIIAGYFLVASAFEALPIPSFLTTTIIGGISLITIAGALTLYSVYILYNKF